MANSDLDKFYKALDRYHAYTKYSHAIVHVCRAIGQYHKAKMQEVNKIIQELWIKIYKGGGRKLLPVQSRITSDLVLLLLQILTTLR